MQVVSICVSHAGGADKVGWGVGGHPAHHALGKGPHRGVRDLTLGTKVSTDGAGAVHQQRRFRSSFFNKEAMQIGNERKEK